MEERKEEQHLPSAMLYSESSCGMYYVQVGGRPARPQSEQAAVLTPRGMRKWGGAVARARVLAFQTGSDKRSRGRGGPEASSDRDRNILPLADTIAVQLFGNGK